MKSSPEGAWTSFPSFLLSIKFSRRGSVHLTRWVCARPVLPRATHDPQLHTPELPEAYSEAVVGYRIHLRAADTKKPCPLAKTKKMQPHTRISDIAYVCREKQGLEHCRRHPTAAVDLHVTTKVFRMFCVRQIISKRIPTTSAASSLES